MDRESTNAASAADHEEISDRIRGVVRGDEEALDWLVEWLTPLMAAWARSWLRDGGSGGSAPEDVVQDVWVRVLPELRRLRPHPDRPDRMTPALLGLVKRILRNRVIDERRRAVRRKLHEKGAGGAETLEAPTSSSGPLSKAMRSERRRLIEQALDRLHSRERAIYVKRVFEQATIAELAAEFGMSEAGVMKARQRVRAKLEYFLAPRLLDDLESS